MFCDFYGEVVENSPRLNSGHQSNWHSFTVTDYTENPALRESDADTINSNNIVGRRVIKCDAWDINAGPSRALPPGTLVFIRNCFVTEWDNTIELKVRADPQFPDKTSEPAPESPAPPINPRASSVPLVHTEPDPVALVEPEPELESIFQSPTVIRFPNRPITPIKEVMGFPKPIWKFRIRARVVACAPVELERFVRIYCHNCQEGATPTPDLAQNGTVVCPGCASVLPDSQYVYSFSMLLEDSSGDRLRVIAYGRDAAQFLPGLAPTNMHSNNATRQSLAQRLGKILPPSITCKWHQTGPKRHRKGTQSAMSTPAPWFDCCIKSYEVEIVGELVRRYQIFGTSLT
ncbi:hypothetical protein BJ085DRAFT_41238 [Dimargaris cristalligena]|uniref:Protection of telomeres protein 1 ssDNA-binding domain-containing protein n=1 Tax=Dimargaris cristalligena TaxID=215637 RepID=A0A4P9ZS81_9FUNG|nr:hypothetical protein BJ085DRAFT_41238 [Dimargaris cristalligena]|eukprot:RKP36394.1 hypothetical protein BJ085DRAFT_41238 [Dimargaris cristalligena]